jgi:hypothetical protein
VVLADTLIVFTIADVHSQAVRLMAVLSIVKVEAVQAEQHPVHVNYSFL